MEEDLGLTRRVLFACIPALMDESPKNQLAVTANAFNAHFGKWAEAFNKMQPGTLDAAENAAFQPLIGAWRKVEQLRTSWIRGL